MDKNMTHMAIGALLHDVGKVVQRSRWQLSPQTMGLEHMLCPKGKAGFYTHRHVLYTNEFFLQLGESPWPGLNMSEIANLASYHHSPSSPEQTIVQQADWLSAGQDRRDREEDTSPGYLKVPLRSLFSRLSLDQSPSDVSWAYPVASAYGRDNIFPQPESEPKSLENQYSRLADDLLAGCRRLAECPEQLFVDSVLSLCRRHMANVPSTTMHEPDVSLFDHASTSAAFACSLLAYHTDTQTWEESALKDRAAPKFMLVSGDLGGIQDFLLDLPHKQMGGLAKILRARSFYLTMITRAASRLLLHRLGLPACNCILDAGGRFVLLLPNTEEAKRIITQTRTEISQWLMANFSGRVALNLSDPLLLAGNDFASSEFRAVVEKLTWQTDLAKKTRFGDCLTRNAIWDTATQIGDNSTKEELNNYFRKLGSKLTHMRYITLQLSSEENTDNDFEVIFNHLRMRIDSGCPALGKDTLDALVVNAEPMEPGFSWYDLAAHVPRIDPSDLQHYQAAGLDRDEDDRPFAPGDMKTFEHLALDAVDDRQRGIRLIGVLKADVDRLGMLFSHGLGDRFSIGRLATFSRQMDLFFRGYLHNLMEENFQDIYTEYAGGDDLLLIGPWTLVIQFARQLRQDFEAYTCHNEEIHLSAAIELAHPRHPISRVIRRADQRLEQAKNTGRNRIAALGAILPWEEFEQAIQEGDFLDGLLNESDQNGQRKLGRGFIYRLLQYHRMYCRSQDQIDVRDMLWRSHLAYDIQRNVKKSVSPEKLQRIETMTQLSGSGREMNRLGVSTTYALYKNRGGSL